MVQLGHAYEWDPTCCIFPKNFWKYRDEIKHLYKNDRIVKKNQ